MHEVCRNAHFLETFFRKKRSIDVNLKPYLKDCNMLMKLVDLRFHANSLVKNQKIKQISHLFGADADWARRNAYSMSQSHALTIHLNMKTKVVITSFLYFVYSFSVIIIIFHGCQQISVINSITFSPKTIFKASLLIILSCNLNCCGHIFTKFWKITFQLFPINLR